MKKFYFCTEEFREDFLDFLDSNNVTYKIKEDDYDLDTMGEPYIFIYNEEKTRHIRISDFYAIDRIVFVMEKGQHSWEVYMCHSVTIEDLISIIKDRYM